MGTIRLNLERFHAAQGDKTLTAFADEIGIDKATMSRVVTGKSLPGNHFIAAMLLNLEHPFSHYFELDD